MKRTLRAAIVGAALLLAPLALAEPGEPSAPALESAREHFQRGVDLYKEGDFEAALVEFTRAYSTAENYRVLYNLGQVHVERHDYVSALRSFREYLRQGGDDVPADRREQVTGDIAKLEQRVASIEVHCNVDGAELLVDDVPSGTTPLQGPLLVNPGPHRIAVRKRGLTGNAVTLSVAGAERQAIELTLRRESGAAGAPPGRGSKLPPPAPAPGEKHATVESQGMGTGFYVALASTGVLAAGAGVFGYLALKSNRDLDDELDAFPTDAAAVDSARDELERNSLLADGLAAGAVIAGGFTLYLGLSSSGDTPDAQQVGMRVRPGRSPSVELEGRF